MLQTVRYVPTNGYVTAAIFYGPCDDLSQTVDRWKLLKSQSLIFLLMARQVPSRAAKYDYLIKLLLIGDSGKIY